MAIKDVLMLLEPADDQDVVANFALSFAATLGAHLTAAGLALELVPPASFVGDFPEDLIVEVTEQARKRVDEAYQRFSRLAPASLQSELVTIQALPGDARDRFARLARHFDLTIVGQRNPESDYEDEAMGEAALFGSGRPVFVVPFVQKAAPQFGKALIAWDGGLPAARALAEALPLLSRAGRVDVVTIIDRHAADNELPGFNITRHLARHGINAELHKLPSGSDPASILLSFAADKGSDYLVMGGYGHSRLREFMLGGTTRTILQSMILPVLMAH
jgi:nucleotide-binding universal stress UspA family protein